MMPNKNHHLNCKSLFIKRTKDKKKLKNFFTFILILFNKTSE